MQSLGIPAAHEVMRYCKNIVQMSLSLTSQVFMLGLLQYACMG